MLTMLASIINVYYFLSLANDDNFVDYDGIDNGNYIKNRNIYTTLMA